jgi:hypothetical protein
MWSNNVPVWFISNNTIPVSLYNSVCVILTILYDISEEILEERFMDVKIKWGKEVRGKQGRRHKKLLGDLKERRVYSHLKEEALDNSMWRVRFRRGFGSVM